MMLVEAFFASSMRTPLIEPLSFEEEWAIMKSKLEAEKVVPGTRGGADRWV